MAHMKRSLDPTVRLLQALADPARLSIVRQLASEGDVCACDLACCGELSQPTVSHHLRVLAQGLEPAGSRSASDLGGRRLRVLQGTDRDA